MYNGVSAGETSNQRSSQVKVRIVQTYLIQNSDDGWTEITDNDGLVLVRKPTLEEAFNDITEMVTDEALTADIESDIVDIVGGAE